MAITDVDQLAFEGRYKGPYQLVSSPQDLTGSWVDLGVELTLGGASYVGLYVELDINLSTNARVRLLAKHATAHADEFTLPIRTVGASDVKVEDEYVEFNTDADQKMLLSWDLDGVVLFGQFQVQAGTVGGTAAQIDDAWVVTGI